MVDAQARQFVHLGHSFFFPPQVSRWSQARARLEEGRVWCETSRCATPQTHPPHHNKITKQAHQDNTDQSTSSTARINVCKTAGQLNHAKKQTMQHKIHTPKFWILHHRSAAGPKQGPGWRKTLSAGRRPHAMPHLRNPLQNQNKNYLFPHRPAPSHHPTPPSPPTPPAHTSASQPPPPPPPLRPSSRPTRRLPRLMSESRLDSGRWRTLRA